MSIDIMNIYVTFCEFRGYISTSGKLEIVWEEPLEYLRWVIMLRGQRKIRINPEEDARGILNSGISLTYEERKINLRKKNTS